MRNASMKPLGAWMEFGAASMRRSPAAGEVIARRTGRMAPGAMTPPEAVAMALENGAAFAAATEGAAAARGGDAARMALKPCGAPKLRR